MADTVKHTPGPWSRGIDGNNRVYGPDGCGEHSGLIAVVYKTGANSTLIAAAPDLHEALIDMRDAYSKPDERLCCDGRDCGCMGSTVHQQAEHYARAAIAKATGVQ